MPKRVKDPVCGMEIEKDVARGPLEYKENIFYFCSDGCKEKFNREPGKYISRDVNGGDGQ